MKILTSDRMPLKNSSANSSARAHLTPDTLKTYLVKAAHSYGFDLIGITGPDQVRGAAIHLQQAVDLGYLGEMDWMYRTLERRMNPANLWPDVRSIIMIAMNYGPDHDPRKGNRLRNKGMISVYARHRDYHDILKGRLKQMASGFAAFSQENVKIFVDTAPLMEKPLAAAAGLGWQGKHTNLVNRTFGSWLFLGAMFTTALLPFSIGETEQSTNHCGSCQACLDHCPTNAFPAPYQLDARRCISYLTIELKEQIPEEFRKAIGNRIYGCDDCLAACPWNKFAQETHEIKLQARNDLKEPALSHLLTLDDAAFRSLFAGSPIKRIGRDRFIRNVLIACGNSEDETLIPNIKPHLFDPSPLVRAMAVWALKQLLSMQEFAILFENFFLQEQEETVKIEWQIIKDQDAL